MLSKIVIALIAPLGTGLLLVLCGLLLLASARRRRAAVALVAAGWLWLLAWSLPVVSDSLRGAIEARAGPRAVDAVAPAPAIVVLGGAVAPAQPPLRPQPDLNSASDRVWHAARLYRAGKAPLVILSGGSRPEEAPEAEGMRRFLLDLGVPASAILLESASRNTAGNAELTAQMLRQRQVRRIILVTSALHMPRARRAFEALGLEVVTAPTDFEVVDKPLDLLRLLPDGEALDGSGRAIKEIVGGWVQR